MMTPISYICEATLPLAPEEFARGILDLTKWSDFLGLAFGTPFRWTSA